MKLRIARKICKAVADDSERYHPAQLHRALQRTERTKSDKEIAAFFDEVINALTGKPTRICKHPQKDRRFTGLEGFVADVAPGECGPGQRTMTTFVTQAAVINPIERDDAMQTQCEDVRYYEAILCALVARAGGSIRLKASEIDAWGRDARLCINPHWHLEQVSLLLDFGRPWYEGRGDRGEGRGEDSGEHVRRVIEHTAA